MATIHEQPMQMKRTFGVMSLAINGKTTATNLSIAINKRLSMETTSETSGRKKENLHKISASSGGLSTFQASVPEIIYAILTSMMVNGLNRSDTAMLNTK